MERIKQQNYSLEKGIQKALDFGMILTDLTDGLAVNTLSELKTVCDKIFYKLFPLPPGFCLVVGLGHGIKYMQVTTNPVELWAAPNSRSRVERDYFDSHFEPFYRTEMLIISSKGLPKIEHKTANGIVEFGPVFNDTFLKEVLSLQEKIKGEMSCFCSWA